MKLAHRLLILQFFICAVAGVFVKCLTLNVFIKTVGAASLGAYYAYAAVLAFGFLLVNIVISKKIPPIYHLFGVHSVQLMVAVSCLVLDQPLLNAKILFLTVLGFGVNIIFSSWSVTNAYVTSFESKRIFSRIALASQIGFVIGSLFAIASHVGLQESHYLLAWAGVEIVILFLGVMMLMSSRHQNQKIKIAHAPVAKELKILQIIKQYKLVPYLTFWVFLWGLSDAAIETLAGATFDHAGVNLTLLYGIMALSGAVIGIIASVFVYPRVIKRSGLGSVLLIVSLAAFVVGSLYLNLGLFALAIAAFMSMSILNKSFLGTAVNMEIGLYPHNQRDRIRLIGHLASWELGASCVGLLFILPPGLVPWIIWSLLALLVIFGYLSKKYFHKDILEFLASGAAEERDNAIILFDRPQDLQGYEKILGILIGSNDLPLRINVLNTFSSLGSLKPAPAIVKLLKEEKEDPLRIAILRYFSNIPIKMLDPFVKHQLFESLRGISKERVSNNLRAAAVKLWVQNGPVEETIGFILERLKDPDERIIANAIEGLNNVNYPGALQLLVPYLKNPVPRIRANAIVATWKYKEVHFELQKALDEMTGSGDPGMIMSGLWAAGEVGDKSRVDHVRGRIHHADPGIVRNALITLLKLDCEEYADKVVDIIAGSDEGQAIVMCYLVLRVSERILNEAIIAGIFGRGEDKRKVAIQRFSRCGGFCRDQLTLLSGERLYDNYA